MKRAVLYLRVSTIDQTTANQERELRQIAGRTGCEIVKVYKDHGISGAKGRDKRPAFDAPIRSSSLKAKRALQEIWMAEIKKDALAAFDAFVETWGVKYEKAVECLIKDREALLAFYDFPAEHWKHLRTTNVIESSFATVRHRTVRSKGCLSNKTALAMIFKLAEAAERSWRRLNGHNQLPKIILGVKFIDGIDRKLNPLPPNPFRHQDSAIAPNPTIRNSLRSIIGSGLAPGAGG